MSTDDRFYKFRIGDQVKTTFGKGEIIGKTSNPKLYLVNLEGICSPTSMHVAHMEHMPEAYKGLFPGQHKFKLGQKVYCSKLDRWREGTHKYIICGLLCAPAYSMHYTVVREDKQEYKLYVREQDISKEPMIETRKELYGAIGTQATKIIRGLRDRGVITIDLPASEKDL